MALFSGVSTKVRRKPSSGNTRRLRSPSCAWCRMCMSLPKNTIPSCRSINGCTVVLSEGVHRPPHAHDKEKTWESVVKAQRAMAEKAGLVTIYDHIKDGPNVKRSGLKAIETPENTMRLLSLTELIPGATNKVDQKFMRKLLAHTVNGDFDAIMGKLDGMDWLQGDRDKALAESLAAELQNHGPEKSIGILYGRGHMEPLHKWLVTKGFRVTKELWVTAFTIE